MDDTTDVCAMLSFQEFSVVSIIESPIKYLLSLGIDNTDG